MAFNIDTFRTKISDGGARNSLYEISLTWPTGVRVTASGDAASSNPSILCISTSIPGKSINNIPMQYRGRTVNIPGNSQFNTWTTTIINNDGTIRNTILDWIRILGGAFDGTRTDTLGGTTAVPLNNNLFSTGKVSQLSKSGTVVQEYNFTNMFPLSISAINLDWGDDNPQQFSCTWRFDYWGHVDASGTTEVTVVNPNGTTS